MLPPYTSWPLTEPIFTLRNLGNAKRVPINRILTAIQVFDIRFDSHLTSDIRNSGGEHINFWDCLHIESARRLKVLSKYSFGKMEEVFDHLSFILPNESYKIRPYTRSELANLVFQDLCEVIPPSDEDDDTATELSRTFSETFMALDNFVQLEMSFY